MSVVAEPFDDTNFDTLIVGGGAVVEPATPGLIEFVQQALGRCRRVASICIGAFILAAAGPPDGRRATTHWYHPRELQAPFPNVKMEEEPIFPINGAGVDPARPTPGIDLAPPPAQPC